VTVLADVLRRGARRVVAHQKLGLITPPQAQYSDAEPLRSIMEKATPRDSGGTVHHSDPGSRTQT